MDLQCPLFLIHTLKQNEAQSACTVSTHKGSNSCMCVVSQVIINSPDLPRLLSVKVKLCRVVNASCITLAWQLCHVDDSDLAQGVHLLVMESTHSLSCVFYFSMVLYNEAEDF